MPKTKHRAAPKKHQNHMDKVKIKRTKRIHHEISTKEKVLGGLGVGSALISGVGAVATNPNSTQFVRNVEDGMGGRVRDVLNSVFGVQKAAASSEVTVNGRNIPYNTTVGSNGSVIYTFQLSDGSNVSANSGDIQSTIASLTSLLSSGGAGVQATLVSEEISILRQLYLLNQGSGNNTQPSVTDVADDEGGGEIGDAGQNLGGNNNPTNPGASINGTNAGALPVTNNSDTATGNASISTASALPSGRVGQSYQNGSFKLVAICPTSNIFQWTVSEGRLPAGMVLAYTGELVGTPTQSGTFTFRALATSQVGLASASRVFTVVIAPSDTSQSFTTPAGDDSEVEVLNEGGGLNPGATNTGGDDEVEVTSETADGGTGAATGSGGSGALGGGGGLSGTATGGAGGGVNSGSQNTDAATIASLQAQIAALQNRLNSLQQQSVTPVYQNDPNLLAQISQLQNQINTLSQALSRIQGQSVITYSQNSTGLQYSQVVAAQGGQTAGVQTGGTYTVKKGDNLWNISKKYYGDGKLWRNILSANPQCLSRPGNVRTLKVGYVLTIPTLNNQSTIQTYSNQPKSQVQPAAEQKSSTIQTYSLNSQSTVKQALNNQKVNQEQEVEVLSETDSLSGQNTDAIKQSGGANILGAATQNNSNAINPASTGNTQKPTFVPSVSDLSDVE